MITQIQILAGESLLCEYLLGQLQAAGTRLFKAFSRNDENSSFSRIRNDRDFCLSTGNFLSSKISLDIRPCDC